MNKIFVTIVLTMMSVCGITAQTTAKLNQVNNLLTYMKRAMLFNQAAPQEKVYLHFDNTGYFKGETIYFKAYLTRMDNGKKSNISKVLYVELVNPIGDVCERRTLKVEDGEAQGDIKLDSIVGASGFYEVRAFTRYMTNWGTPAVFSRVFPIFSKPKQEGDYSKPVIDQQSFRHRLPNTRVDEEGQQLESTTDLNYTSVKFYPEGGNLVQGLKSRVAFTVTDAKGMHAAVKGQLLNANKEKICDVETDATGRGVFEVTSDNTAKYVQMTDAKGKKKEYKLPDAEPDGCTLMMDVMDDLDITATIQSTPSMVGRLLGYTIIHNGNVVECDTLTAETNIVRHFDKLSMPEGVNQLTFFDASGQILAERLFFILPYSSADDSIVVTTDMRSLSPCGKITLDLQAQPNSSISFSAMDAATMTNGKEGNMKTWMLLSSDLSGYIDSPDYYFESNDEEHRRAADMLMMVQGWRRYDWSLMAGMKTLNKVEPNEDGLYVFGQLMHRSKKKDVANVELSAFLYNRQGQSMSGKATTDSIGRYSFQLPECYNDFALQIKSKKDGEAENYIIGIDRHFSPAMRVLSPYENQMIPVGECNFFKEKADEEPEEEEFVSITKKVHVLPTVKIKTRRILGDLHSTWYDEDMAQRIATVFYDCDPYADEIADKGEDLPTFDDWLKVKNSLIDGKANPPVEDCAYVDPNEDGLSGEVQDLDPKNAVVQREEIFNKEGEKPILVYREGLTYDNRPIVWIVDNTFCTITNFGYRKKFSFLRTNNHTGLVERPDYLNVAKSIYFTEDLSTLDEFIVSDDLPGMQPVVAFVYTHPLYYSKEKGLRKSHFSGYNLPTKFEMEDYSIMPPMEDFRRTLFWEPNVKTDSKGKAKIEFYNNSSAKEFFISAEGVTSEGKILVNE